MVNDRDALTREPATLSTSAGAGGIADRCRRASERGDVLAATALLAPLLACFAPLGLTPLLVTSSVATIAIQVVVRDRLPVRTWAVLPFVMLASWAILTMLWAIEPMRALDRGWRLAFELAVGSLLVTAAAGLNPAARLRVGGGLALGTTIAAGVLLFEGLTAGALWDTLSDLLGVDPYDPIRYNRSASALVLFAWPAALALWLRGGRYRVAGVALALLAVAAVWGHHSVTARLAVPVALAAGGVALLLSRRAIAWVVGVALVVGVLTAPLVASFLPSYRDLDRHVEVGLSLGHRLDIWRFAADRIAERPLAGWGMEASRTIPGGDAPAWVIPGDPERGRDDLVADQMPLHPHNASLQVWLELGLIGALLFAGVLVVAVIGIARLPAGVPAAASWATLAAAVTIAHSSYGIWQSWWIACLWLAAILVVAIARAPVRSG